jgi:hypothetical protein
MPPRGFLIRNHQKPLVLETTRPSLLRANALLPSPGLVSSDCPMASGDTVPTCREQAVRHSLPSCPHSNIGFSLTGPRLPFSSANPTRRPSAWRDWAKTSSAAWASITCRASPQTNSSTCRSPAKAAGSTIKPFSSNWTASPGSVAINSACVSLMMVVPLASP